MQDDPTALWPHHLHALIRSTVRTADDQTDHRWSPGDWQHAAARAFTALGAQASVPDRSRRRLLVGCLRQGLRLARDFRAALAALGQLRCSADGGASVHQTAAMNETWLGSVSALGGVLVTGVLGLVGQHMNRRAAEKAAAVQMVRDLSKWHRELRRQSYVDCIVTYEKMRDVLAPLVAAIPWPVTQAMNPQQVSRLEALLVTLGERYEEVFQKCQIVRLEGPERVAAAAQRLILAAAGFRHAAEERAGAARSGRAPLHAPAWDSASREMHEALEAFIEIARPHIAVD